MAYRARPLGSGIKLYFGHRRKDGRTLFPYTERYNFYNGMIQLRDLINDPVFRISAIGTESGTMVVHFLSE